MRLFSYLEQNIVGITVAVTIVSIIGAIVINYIY